MRSILGGNCPSQYRRSWPCWGFEDAQRSHHSKLLIAYLLFYSKKQILLKWILSSPPALSSWEALIDAALPMYRITYMNSGCKWKYDKVWAPWTST